MFYQKSTNRIVSSNIVLNVPVAVAFPYSNTDNMVVIGTGDSGAQATSVGSGTPTHVTDSTPFGAFGLLPDPQNDANYYACVGTFPPVTNADPYLCGILYFDGSDAKATYYYDFSDVHVSQGGNCLVDDLVITTSDATNTALYATDSNAFQIYKYDLLTDEASVINSDMSLLCSVYDTDPNACGPGKLAEGKLAMRGGRAETYSDCMLCYPAKKNKVRKPTPFSLYSNSMKRCMQRN